MNNSVLVFSKLKSQVNFVDIESIKLDEPLHPYLGYNWALSIKKLGFIVEFLNSKKSQNRDSESLFNWIYNYIFLPSEFNILVVHSTNGLLKTTFLRFFNIKKEIVFYYLSLPNPDGGFAIKLIRKICVFFGLLMCFKNSLWFGLFE